MTLISNGLLSELNNFYHYDILDESRSTVELASKCKDWAATEGYFFMSGYSSFQGDYKACCIVTFDGVEKIFFDENLNLERNCILLASEYVFSQLNL